MHWDFKVTDVLIISTLRHDNYKLVLRNALFQKGLIRIDIFNH